MVETDCTRKLLIEEAARTTLTRDVFDQDSAEHKISLAKKRRVPFVLIRQHHKSTGEHIWIKFCKRKTEKKHEEKEGERITIDGQEKRTTSWNFVCSRGRAGTSHERTESIFA